MRTRPGSFTAAPTGEHRPRLGVELTALVVGHAGEFEAGLRGALVIAGLIVVALGGSAAGDEPPTSGMLRGTRLAMSSEPSPAELSSVRESPAPFTALVIAEAANVRQEPSANSPAVGVLHRGAYLRVNGCRPDCTTTGAWALVGGDGPTGAVRLSLLKRQDALDPAGVVPPPEELAYGKVGKDGLRIYRSPKPGAPTLSRQAIPREMAFRKDAVLEAAGWLDRVEGGYVRARAVEPLHPSTFAGEVDPKLPMVFVLRDLASNGKSGAVLPPEALHRYDRFALRAIHDRRVETDVGSLPRSAVRIVAQHARPAGVPAGARWVLVDLGEQTLTAYEGERPVLATLVSAGKPGDETMTHPGLYRVQDKLAFSDMDGQPDDPYSVDRVPYVLYFNKNEALHAAYWHDRFGTPASHGCVNLSLADARRLFEWAPPKLPAGWDAVAGASAPGTESLWVLVENHSRLAVGGASDDAATASAGTASAATVFNVPKAAPATRARAK